MLGTIAIVLGCMLVIVGVCVVAYWYSAQKGGDGDVKEGFDVDDMVGVETLPVELTNKLKCYLSTLGTNSYVEGATVWRDISGNDDQPVSCEPKSFPTARDFLLNDKPNFDDIRNGIGVKNVVMTGPRSENMGLVGADDFTLYWCAKTSGDLAAAAAPVPVFVLYANTLTNIAIRVSLQQEGTQCKVLVENTFDDHGLSATEIPISGSFSNAAGPCSFAVVRSQNTLTVYFNDVAQGAPIPCGEEKILLSNRNAVINPAVRWDAKLIAFAVYKRALAQSEVAAITAYIQRRRVVLDDQYQSLLKANQAMQNKTACPFTDKSVCNVSCVGISDWSNPTNFLQNASVECRSGINAYCKANPNEEFCSCWSEANKNNNACKVLKSYFDQALVSTTQRECDVRKLYPNSKEPSLEKYYAMTGPIVIAAIEGAASGAPRGSANTATVSSGNIVINNPLDAKLPNDMVVNWNDGLPINTLNPIAELGGTYTLPNTVPSDRVVDYFGVGVTSNAAPRSAASNQIKDELARMFKLK